MTLDLPNTARAKLDEVRAIATDRLSAKDAEWFLGALDDLLATAAADELNDPSAEEIYGATLGLWKFCQQRAPGTSKVRVYNPRTAEHGWESHHTIVETITEDMPFLVDSLTMLVNAGGQGVRSLIHPLLTVTRDAKGKLTKLVADGAEGALRESVIQVHIDQISDPATISALQAEIERMLADVRVAVQDWHEMLDKRVEVTATLRKNAPEAIATAVAEGGDFLDWMAENHFTFLGYREFRRDPDTRALQLVEGTGLGLMRDPDYTVLRDSRGNFTHWSPELEQFTDDTLPVLIVKANRRSNIHRSAHFDLVCVTLYDKMGKAVGEGVFVGLFTSAAYNRSPLAIPILREKVRRAIARAGFAPSSHDGKALINVLETYPRDELFQATDETLFANAIGVLHLSIRPRTRLFTRADRFGRFVSALVYVPRERYSTELRVRIGQLLCDAYDGRVASWSPSFNSDGLVRVHFVIALEGEAGATLPDDAEIEAQITEAVRSWSDTLRDAVIDRHGEALGHQLHTKFGNAFGAFYRETVSVSTALADIDRLEELSPDQPLRLHFYRRLEDPDTGARFKIYHWGGPVPLSDALPVLENMGFRILNEQPHHIEHEGGEIHIHDFEMQTADGIEIDLTDLRAKFEEAFDAVWAGRVDDDRLNRMVMLAGLTVRETALLRSYSRYLRQARIPYSIDYMDDALAANPRIARKLVSMFAARFDPAAGGSPEDRLAASAKIAAEIETMLNDVPSLDMDQILRRFRNAIDATLRTNYYQPDANGAPKLYMSFKLDSGALDDLPKPRPWREIFVHSARMEGVHLRGGPVARGGLRWSDRKEDYRTEVLGLVKAQQVKNAVIVPVGSKGGFLPKALPVGGTREEIQDEAIRCYRIFLAGLLDVTDNLVGGEVSPPADVIRLDDDDPYLVVAADKGTATFSDIANAVAADYGFWLGDAFASGGSNGYDHKGMAITARGAWEAVKRHFREMGHDTQTQPFSVIGVGDMSGDVFGNGMLLSEQIRLIAAFDHRDIFIDPDPDTAKSFAERARLFTVPRSSWQDYDKALISKGGGIFPRSLKSITLSPEMKKMSGLTSATATPAELIHALLAAPCDLLWFGGIGTYIKATGETHADAGDRANDAIRVNGAEVRARVVGEGANLGTTQLGRIEMARAGVRLNTDAVDNSAGVDCSDHEVNIKITLGAVVAEGDMTEKQRNSLLAKMTDEVGELVLADNYDQTLAISMIEARGGALLEDHARLMRSLESQGRLDRVVEQLPSEESMAELAQKGLGLTRPEIAVLVAYAKIDVFDQIVGSDLPDDPYCVNYVVDYMPHPLRTKYRAAILDHRLRREIIATVLANALVNEIGPSLPTRLSEETGCSQPEIARAFVAARAIFDTESLRDAINALDNKVTAEVQTTLHLALSDTLISQSASLVARGQGRTIGEMMDQYGEGVRAIAGAVGPMLSDFASERHTVRCAELLKAGAPEELAARTTALEFLGGALDVVDVARTLDRPVLDVAETYFAAGGRFGFDWLRAASRALIPADNWERVALSRLIADLRAQQCQFAAAALNVPGSEIGRASIEAWARDEPQAVARADRLMDELREGGALSFAKLSVALSQFRTIGA